MKKTLLLAVCLAFLATLILSAQPRHVANFQRGSKIYKMELGKRYLKLGNTYMMANKFYDAEKYLRLAQDIFDSNSDLYWRAAAYEYNGYLYLHLGDRNLAMDYLWEALNIYNKVITMPGGSHEALAYLIQKIENGGSIDQTPIPSLPGINNNNGPLKGGNMGFIPKEKTQSLPSLNQMMLDLRSDIADLKHQIERIEKQLDNTPSQNTRDLSFRNASR